VQRPAGAPTTLLILCLKGVGRVRSGNESVEIHAGHLVWLPANEAHDYGASERTPWTIGWVHFAGEEVAAWRKLMGAGASSRPSVLELPDDRLDQVALDRVYAPLERGYGVREQIAAAVALRQALSSVAQLLVAPRNRARPAGERVAASIERLRRDWQQTHRLGELAAAAGVSVTHYSTLFRRHTGFSPVNFVIRMRIQQACRLLDTTKLSVGEVAERTGYQDAYYFTRCFRRIMGRAPRAYRKVPKG
jgi:AraC family transcriptional regulator, arabinose operon regulatory protein